MFKDYQFCILAGGKGTRLKTIVSDRPKSMAIVNGRPFLDFILENLHKFEISEVNLLVGYKHRDIINHYGEKFKNIKLTYSIENKLLGTGGAIKNAASNTSKKYLVVLNGDTYCPINIKQLLDKHSDIDHKEIIGIRHLSDPKRYGLIKINEHDRVISFEEKKVSDKGYINIGAYILSSKNLTNFHEDIFSLEETYLKFSLIKRNLYAFKTFEDFIDIGIPSDYIKSSKIVKPYE